MPNMSQIKNVMPTLDAEKRRRVFSEVALGYSEAQAIDEAARCLNCKDTHTRIYSKNTRARLRGRVSNNK